MNHSPGNAFVTLASRESIAGERPAASAQERIHPAWILSLLMLHVPLALTMSRMPFVATVHSLAVLLIGLFWAASGKRPEQVAYVVAYVCGAEVLWRMSHAEIYWEFGKYATALILVLALLRRRWLSLPLLPSIYFLLLLPAAFMTVSMQSLERARDQISFNLSGPLSLMLCVWFFSQTKLTRTQFQRLILFGIAPVVGIAAIAIFSTVSATNIEFRDASNFTASGGYGPNQVSAILGLGAVMAFFYYMVSGTRFRSVGIIMCTVMAVFATQAALTFSRGGLYMAAASVLLGCLHLFSAHRTRRRIVFSSVVLFLLTNYVLLPRLESFTEGALLKRYQNTDTTHRDAVVRDELEVWGNNFVLGAGPGRGRADQETSQSPVASHTEFTRLLAEHGLFGLGAIFMLFLMGAHNIMRLRGNWKKATALSFMAWSVLFMAIYAMRLVAPSFAFGLSSAMFTDDEFQDASVQLNAAAPIPPGHRP